MKKPNILFLLMDDTQKDCLGCYRGQGKVHTPVIDRLAGEGVRFERAYCSSTVCTPSRYSYMTGRYAGRNEDERFCRDNPAGDISKINFNVVINENTPTVFGMLKEAGYQTGYVGKWHTGRDWGELGMPDFESEEDLTLACTDRKIREAQQIMQKELKRTTGIDYTESIVWGNVDEMPLHELRYHNLEWMTQGALTMLDQFQSDQPFFMQISTSSFHGPGHHTSMLERDPSYTWSGYDPNLAYAVKERAELRQHLLDKGLELNHQTVGSYWTDYQFGIILEHLRKKGMLDDTIIIYGSDHGVEPAKASCYEFGTRIPLIIRWPNSYQAGKVSHDIVQNIDLAPTLLQAAGVKITDTMQFDGIPIQQIMDGTQQHDSLYFEIGFLRAVLKDEFKYIALRYPRYITNAAKKGDMQTLPNYLDLPSQHQPYVTMDVYPYALDPDQLYDLKTDPHEQQNVAQDVHYQDRLTELRTELDQYLRTFDTHPYPLADKEIFELPNFEKLKNNLVNKGLDPVSWWSSEDSKDALARMKNTEISEG